VLGSGALLVDGHNGHSGHSNADAKAKARVGKIITHALYPNDEDALAAMSARDAGEIDAEWHDLQADLRAVLGQVEHDLLQQLLEETALLVAAF